MKKYADTDFLLSLVKEEDWLKSRSKEVLEKHEGEIVTSAVAILEVVVVLKREEVSNLGVVVGNILEIVDLLYVDEEDLLKAVLYIEEDDVTPFDAFHAALSKDLPVISSDSVYDQLGINRIKLED